MEELLREFMRLVEALRELAPHAWAILVRQAIVGAWHTIANSLITLLLASALAAIARFLIWKDDRRHSNGTRLEDHEDRRACAKALWVVAFIAAAIAMFTLSDGIAHLLNPEYWALKDILSQLK